MKECSRARIYKLSVEERIEARFLPTIFYDCFDRQRVGCLYYWNDE